MACRVQIHHEPFGVAGLMRMTGAASVEDQLFGIRDGIDIEVQVTLLRDVSLGPFRCSVVLDLLARNMESEVFSWRTNIHPVSPRLVICDLPAQQSRVELGEVRRIGAVEGEHSMLKMD